MENIPSSTFSKTPPLVIKLNFSFISESNETFILLTPYLNKLSEYLLSCVPLVVKSNSSISLLTFFDPKNFIYSIMSLRIRGSPPVILIFFIPSLISASDIFFKLLRVKISFFIIKKRIGLRHTIFTP